MHETIKCYVTVRFALSEKLALKTPNVLIKNVVYRWFRAIFRTIDGLLRYGTVRYGRVWYGTLETSDNNGLPTVQLFLWKNAWFKNAVERFITASFFKTMSHAEEAPPENGNGTVGSANLSEFFSAPYRIVPYRIVPYRIVPYRNRPSIVLKNSANQRKTPFVIKTFSFFNTDFSDSMKPPGS